MSDNELRKDLVSWAHRRANELAEKYPDAAKRAVQVGAMLEADGVELSELRKLVEIAKCPNCDGSGVIVTETTGIEPGCCGRPNRDGSCCGNAVPIQTREQEQQPCQWCDERARRLRDPARGEKL